MSFYSSEELKKMGFKCVGENVLISRNAEIFGHENIAIFDNVRIDSGCKLLAATGQFNIGNYVHLACDSIFLCAGGITIGDYCNVAMKCVLLSASDDFSGDYLIGPMIPETARSVYKSRIRLETLAVVGVGGVLSPGTTLLEGAALGALSVTKKNQTVEADSIYIGNPARFLKKRTRRNRDLALEMGKNKF